MPKTMTVEPTKIGRAALVPQYMTPEQVADLVARAKANESRARIEGIAKQAAANRATCAKKRAIAR